jgi:hypothetical protein
MSKFVNTKRVSTKISVELSLESLEKLRPVAPVIPPKRRGPEKYSCLNDVFKCLVDDQPNFANSSIQSAAK